MPTQHCACGAKYRFGDSSVGKKAKCKKCGAVFTLSGGDDEDIYAISESPPKTKQPSGRPRVAPPDFDQYGAGSDSEGDDAGLGDLEGALAVSAAVAPTSSDEVVPASYLPSADSQGKLGKLVIETNDGERGLFRALSKTCLYVDSVGNVISFLLFWGLLSLSGILLGSAGCIGLIGQLIVAGWYCSFRLQVIGESAGGSDDLPTLGLTAGKIEGILIPLFQWLATWLIVLAPAFVVLIVTGSIGAGAGTMGVRPLVVGGVRQLGGGMGGLLSDFGASSIVFLALVGVGVFCWPLIILCVTLGGFSTLGRPDLMIMTVIRTFPAYLMVVLFLVAQILLVYVLNTATLSRFGGDSQIGMRILAVGVVTYAELITLRLIGLYYHRSKDRFAWDWE